MILIHHSPCRLLPHDTPGTFSALMDLYERNYINMRRLLPVMPPPSTIRVSKVPGGLDLHLRMIARCRYTSELNLTYEFIEENGTVVTEPDLRIRVYHDAQLAEVMAAHLRHYAAAFTAGFLPSARPDGAQLHARWQINRFLYKWLTYCLRQGHRFTEPPSHQN